MPDYTPRRVVSLQPSATVILRDLGRLDCLVACTKYCAEVCPEVRRETTRGKMAIVADSWTAQSQQISDAHPDLVIAAVPYQEKAVSEILKSGARFLGPRRNLWQIFMATSRRLPESWMRVKTAYA